MINESGEKGGINTGPMTVRGGLLFIEGRCFKDSCKIVTGIPTFWAGIAIG
jgi:hypothetical protein